MANRKVATDLSSVIRSHTETKTLEELAAQGKRRVRVVSSQKVMRIIQAIVDDTIAQETHEQVRQGRDRIVSETRGQFDRVMKIQSEQEGVIREQKELVRKYREKAEFASEQLDRLTARYEEDRDDWAERETSLISGYRQKLVQLQEELAGRTDLANAESQRRIASLELACEDARRREEDARELSLVSERSLSRAEAKLAAAEATNQGQEREIRRLSDRIDDAVADAAKRENVLTRRYEERIAALEEENRGLDFRLSEERTVVDSGLKDAEQKAGLVEARLATATELVATHEETIDRLNAELGEAHRKLNELTVRRDEARDAAADGEVEVRRTERKLRRMQVRQTTLRSQLAERERDVERLTEELGQADLAIREVREGAEAKARAEVGEMKELLRSLARRGSEPDETTLEALLGRLTEREAQLEDRLNVQLDRTLTEINRSLHRATAGPIEVVGEATDVLVGRIFDAEHEMTSNLDSLEVEEVATKSGVSNSIARLRAARGEDAESAS